MVALLTEFDSVFTISEDKMLLDMPWVIDRLMKSYWGGRYTPEKIAEAVTNSLCFGLYRRANEDAFDQIGFARVVTDIATFSSLTDLYVDKEYRNLGLGTKIMEALMKHSGVRNTICILGTKHAHAFYARFGFQPREFGEVMTRNPL